MPRRWAEYFQYHLTKSRVEDTVKLLYALEKYDATQKSKERDYDEQKDVKENQELHHINAKAKKVLDLGCGTGNDALYFLKAGFEVTVQDGEEAAIEIVKDRCRAEGLPAPKTIVAKFEAMEFPEQYDIINASLALPFVDREYFPSFWIKIFQHLKENGRFSGNFFGNHHAWVDSPEGQTEVYLTYNEVRDLFRPFCVQGFAEEAAPAQTVLEGQKFWHQWDVVAQKKSVSPLLFLMPPPGKSSAKSAVEKKELSEVDKMAVEVVARVVNKNK